MSMMNQLMKEVIANTQNHETNYFYHYIFELIHNASEGEKIEILKRLTLENNIWFTSDIGMILQELLLSLTRHKNIIISILSTISLLHIYRYQNNATMYYKKAEYLKEKMLSLTDNDKFGVITIMDVIIVHTILLIPKEKDVILPFVASIMNHCTKYNLDYEASYIAQDHEYISNAFFEYQKLLRASVFFEADERFTLLYSNDKTRKYIDLLLLFLPLKLVPY